MTPEELYNDAENALKVAGRAFYPLEREMLWEIAQAHGYNGTFPFERVVWAYAALSPQQTWSQNVQTLKRMLVCEHDLPFENPGTLPDAAYKAYQSLHGVKAVKGMKVCSFARAILGDPNAVAIDRWMLRSLGHGSDNCTDAQYHRYEQYFRKLAWEREEEPRALQAIVWLGMREPTRRLL